MHEADVVAMAYHYPGPEAYETLSAAVRSLPKKSSARSPMEKFLGEVEKLSIGEWEELHTVTLDLNPHFVPYVGHVTWGESYRRGEFMADLKREMGNSGIDLLGELPDHIEPILRYVARAAEPLADLTKVLPAAVSTMTSALKTASPKNPYRHVLGATQAVVTAPVAVRIGAPQ